MIPYRKIPALVAILLTLGVLYYLNSLRLTRLESKHIINQQQQVREAISVNQENSIALKPAKFNVDLPDFSVTKNMLNIPEWYRTKDWGLKKDPKLETINVTSRALDKEELTSWNRFFFGTTGGLMLELGAMNGDAYSVSYFYEEFAKWRTILIEANPTLASQLTKNRPKALNFNVAICSEPQAIHFLTEGNMLYGVGGIVEFMTEGFITRFHSRWLTDGKMDWKKVAKDKDVTLVQCLPLVDLLESLEITHVNFFLLDVEGGELNILKGIDFDKISFDVIAVETDRGTDSAELVKEYVNAVTEVMTRNGYLVWKQKVGRNSWFYNKDFVPFNSTSANPNLKDEPEV